MIKINCKNCNKEFEKEKRFISETKNNFCSRSCSATYNNKKYPKRSCSNICKCGKKLSKTDTIKCVDCLKLDNWKLREEKLLKDCISNTASRAKFNVIRFWAREKMKYSNISRKCKFCDFYQVLEVCHIKPISTFSLDSKISEVNNLDNLIYLCPNHHALLDRNLLNLNC